MSRFTLITALLVSCVLSASSASAGCDPDHPDCSCGKIPVCVISGHPMGFYSSVWFNGSADNWKGFGEDFDSFIAAVDAEQAVADALREAMPCVEPITTDRYQAAILLAMEESSQRGLTKKLSDARAAGDAGAVAEAEREIQAVFEEYGAGDFPWRDPELAQAQLSRRMLGCSVAQVQLSAQAKNGSVVLYGESSSGPGGVDSHKSRAEGSTMSEAVSHLAKDAARRFAKAQAKLFCECQDETAHCVTTNFEMGSQVWRCDITTRCCDGRVVSTNSETGSGIRAGGGSRKVPGCCSELSVLRQSQDPEDAEQKGLANEIWCEGTWNLRADDMDCDGKPNAADPDPWPPGEGTNDD